MLPICTEYHNNKFLTQLLHLHVTFSCTWLLGSSGASRFETCSAAAQLHGVGTASTDDDNIIELLMGVEGGEEVGEGDKEGSCGFPIMIVTGSMELKSPQSESIKHPKILHWITSLFPVSTVTFLDPTSLVLSCSSIVLGSYIVCRYVLNVFIK